MKLLLFPFLLIGIFGQTLFTQVDSRLAAELQTEITLLQSEFDVVGLSVAIALPDDSIWTGAVGNNAATTPMTSDLLMGIGSATKIYTACTLLLMSEEGLLSLEDSIYKYLPAIPNVDSTITIRQLMQHTSGVYNFTDHPTYPSTLIAHSSETWRPDDVFAAFVEAPYFSPGTAWTYSNTNYLLLGLILEKIKGKSIVELFHYYIFDPLDLHDTYFPIEESIPSNLAHPWSSFFGTSLDLFELGISIDFACSTAWTGGAIISTAKDLVRFSQAVYEGNLLSEASKAAMNDYLVVPDTFIGYDYGLGSMRHTLADGTVLVGHSGNKTYRSFVNYSEADEVSLAFLCNDNTFERPQMTEAALRLLNIIRRFQLMRVSESDNPLEWTLSPNPANEQVALRFTLPQSATVSINIYDIQGRLIRNLQPATLLLAGQHHLQWNPPVPGTYFYQLMVDGKIISAQLVAQ